MRTLRSLMIFALSMLSVVGYSNAQQQDDSASKALAKIENELAKADQTGSAETWQKYLASDYAVRDENGKVWDKESTIESAKSQAKGAGAVKESISDLKAATLGNYALVTFEISLQVSDKHMMMEVADMFRKESDGWKLAARTSSRPTSK